MTLIVLLVMVIKYDKELCVEEVTQSSISMNGINFVQLLIITMEC